MATTQQKQKLSEGLQKRINEANKLIDEENKIHKKAGEVIIDAYNYAIDVDSYSPQEARQILYNNLRFSARTIRRFLPEEAKMTERRNKPRDNTVTTTEEEEESYDITPMKWNDKRKISELTEEEFQNRAHEMTNCSPRKPGKHDAKLSIKEARNFAKQLSETLPHYPKWANVIFTVVNGKITFKVTDL